MKPYFGRVFAVIPLALLLNGCRDVDAKIGRGFEKSARAIDTGSTKIAHAAGKREDQFNAGWKKSEPIGNPKSAQSSHDDGVDLSFLVSFLTASSDSGSSQPSQPARPLAPMHELRTQLTGPRIDLVALSQQLTSLPVHASEEKMWRHLGLGWPPPVQIDRAPASPQSVQYIRLMVGSDADFIYGRDFARGTVIVPPWREGLDWPKPAPPPLTPEAVPVAPSAIVAPAPALPTPIATGSGKDAP